MELIDEIERYIDDQIVMYAECSRRSFSEYFMGKLGMCHEVRKKILEIKNAHEDTASPGQYSIYDYIK